jgi:AcrR family transcriptional regulator
MQIEELAIEPRKKRSQGERSEETRTRVLDATVASIVEDGFQATNLARVAQRAGVTTGAIQHQFGDKATLLGEVVERGFARLTLEVAELPAERAGLADQVAAFVAALWSGYEAHHTRASLEILLAMRSDADFYAGAIRFLGQVRRRIDRMWMGTFWDLTCDRKQHIEAQRLIFTTLNGLAVERILLPTASGAKRDLARLTRNVVDIIDIIDE